MKFIYRNHIILFFLMLSIGTVNAQTLLRATILDKDTKAPIAGAKFGVSGQGIGVFSNEEGKIVYRKYQHVLDKTSQFEVSAKGYFGLKGGIDVLRKIHNNRGVIYLDKILTETDPEQSIESIKIFWDASTKSASRNPDKEIQYVKELLSSTRAKQLSLIIFNEDIILDQRFSISEKATETIENILSHVEYRGISDYGILTTEPADEILLFAEEKPTFGMFELSQNIPVNIINSSRSDGADVYFESLAEYTSGTYKKLSAPKIPYVSSKNGPYVTGRFVKGDTPVPFAIISKKGDLTEYSTDEDGYFRLPAAEGDVFTFYSLGNFPKTLKITSQKNYSVSAVPKAEQLGEVTITTKIKSRYAFDSIRQLDVVEGRTVPIRSIHKSEFNKGAFSIAEAINGMKGVKAYYHAPSGSNRFVVNGKCAKVFIDGWLSSPDMISMHVVENISVYDSPSMVIPCPSRIIITTRMHPDRIDQRLRKRGYEPQENNFYKEKVATLETSSNDTEYFQKKTITGVVRGNGTVLQGASVLRRGTMDEVLTDAEGSFTINASEGDILEVRHFGMYPKSLVVFQENQYEINMIAKAEILDEVELSTKIEKPSTAYDSFDPKTRMETINGKKYDVREVILKEDLTVAGMDIFEMVKASNGRIDYIGDVTSTKKTFFYKSGPSRIPLTVVVDGFETDPMTISPLLVERVSVYIAPLRGDSKIFITTRNHPDIRKKFLAENDIALKNNIYEENVEDIDTESNAYFDEDKVTGRVTVNEIPLEGVSILKKGSLKEVFTDREGFFSITALSGDILLVKHPGMYPKTVVVGDNTNYQIELINKTEILDEVSLSAKKEAEKRNITTAYGEKDRKSVGYKVESKLSKYVSTADVSFEQVALKLPGVLVDPQSKQLFYQRSFGALEQSPILIVLDGVPVSQSTLNTIDPQTITDITALKGVAATNKYGSQAFGGVLVITTLNSTFSETKEKPDLTLKNNSYNESLPTLKFDAVAGEYVNDMASTISTKIKLEKYRNLRETYLDKVDFYVDMALYFSQIDAGAAREVRSDFALLAKDNVKALRILAYLNEHAGEFLKAQKVYERVLTMNPSNPQSYRDLALIYQETGEYNKSLELYINMLGNQIPGVDFSSLTSVLSNELKRLVSLHKHKIEFKRLPNDWLAVNFNIDVRMTASWSDTYAPFEFQFVNPEKRFYNWNSDANKNNDSVLQSTTEEFVVDDAEPGDWLINIRYTGDENQANIPPYLKYTLYKDFGTPKEQKTIKIVKLDKHIRKVTLDSFTY